MYESESEVTQLCQTLCDPMDCSLPSSSIHGIFQARVLEWVAISFSRVSFRPRDQTEVSHIVSKMLYHLSHQGNPTGRRQVSWSTIPNFLRIFHSLLEKAEEPEIKFPTFVGL